jgi:hypothetical protein
VYSCITKPNAQYQIHINSRDTTPTCFGKNVPSAGSTRANVKPTRNGEMIITTFHRLQYNLWNSFLYKWQ